MKHQNRKYLLALLASPFLLSGCMAAALATYNVRPATPPMGTTAPVSADEQIPPIPGLSRSQTELVYRGMELAEQEWETDSNGQVRHEPSGGICPSQVGIFEFQDTTHALQADAPGVFSYIPVCSYRLEGFEGRLGTAFYRSPFGTLLEQMGDTVMTASAVTRVEPLPQVDACDRQLRALVAFGDAAVGERRELITQEPALDGLDYETVERGRCLMLYAPGLRQHMYVFLDERDGWFLALQLDVSGDVSSEEHDLLMASMMEFYALQRGVSLSEDEIDALLTIGPDSRW